MFFQANKSQAKRVPATAARPPLSPKFARLVRESIWFVLVAVLAYVSLVLASSAPGDPAWSYTGDGAPIRNRGGAVGAWLADFLLYLFGLSAWWFVVAGVAIVIASFHGEDGRPITRPFQTLDIDANETRPIQFVGPVGSTEGTIFVGDIVY